MNKYQTQARPWKPWYFQYLIFLNFYFSLITVVLVSFLNFNFVWPLLLSLHDASIWDGYEPGVLIIVFKICQLLCVTLGKQVNISEFYFPIYRTSY